MKQQQKVPGNGEPSIQRLLVKENFSESNILNHLPNAVCVYDIDGFILKYNEQAEKLWGRCPDPFGECERYNDTYRLYYPDKTLLLPEQLPVAQCLKNGVVFNNLALAIERPDQSFVNVSFNIVPLFDDTGKQVGAVSCFHEISDNKEIEKQLKIKTNELQDYVDNANVSLHWVDANGIIKWANRAELDMLGYSEGEYIGHHISEFHVNRDKIEDILRRLSCNETLNQYESELVCKDGSIKTVHINSSVYWDEGNFVHTRCFTLDVSEQKKLLEALTISEKRYKSLVDNLPAAVYTCDKDGRITFFNEVAVDLWGHRPDINSESLKYCACYKVFVNDHYIAPENTPMALTLKTGQTFRNVEVVVERPNGSHFYASVNIDPIIDEDGKIAGAINIFQDITNIKHAEAAVRQSELQYRQLIQHLDTPLYTTDTQGRITLFNKAAVNLWGREPELGKDLWCGSYKILKIDGENLPLEDCPMAVCLKEKRKVVGEQILVVRTDGSIRHVAPNPQPVFDENGNMTGAINMLVDITDLKEAEKALRESENKYRQLASSLELKVKEKTIDLLKKSEDLKKSEERYHKMIEQVEDYAIILLDKVGTIMNWNKGAEKIKGYKDDEIVGKNFKEFYLQADQKNGLPSRLLQLAKKNGKAIHEGFRKRKDGSTLWASIVLTALHDDEGNLIGFSKVTRDLTEKKLAEDRMKEYMNKLEFQNSELEQFVYAASHDMKEPLRKIHFYNEVISKNTSHILNDKSKEYLNRSIHTAERMTKLIDDLLIYSKSTHSTDGYEDVDLNKIIEEIILQTDELKFKKGRIIADKLPIIPGISFQIKQLMNNLVNNSIKYKHPHRNVEIKINWELVNGSDVPWQYVDTQIRYNKISIIDNGIGFEQKYSSKIFDIFQRLNNVADKKGSGIGLAICKKIIQNHNGYITATGTTDIGACFSIYLPAHN